MSFCTAINCMDGRVQLPVIRYLQARFGVSFVDTITEPGPNRILADRADVRTVQAILDRLAISVQKHASVAIAVVGHHDCAGNPAPREVQIAHLQEAVRFLKTHSEARPILALWVDETWSVTEIPL
jgi:carbonic anhydrase